MRQIELLSPAKNLECGIAAIDHGADAVYIGPPLFGARAAAGNSISDIAALCRYAHQYDAKVYATVNTLLYDDEVPQAVSLLHQLDEAGVDAVLIQDMRLAPSVLRAQGETFSFAFHASTQADNRTADRVRQLCAQGFLRAVMARELSIDELRAIHQAVPQMEIEAFVHGALCVSYSGRCFASEHCFQRSANRGECAQFCRMQFDLVDADDAEIEHQRHLLSLKDLNMSRHIADMIDAGVTSLKIEGRLKDTAYVKNVTAAYSQLLDRFIATHADSYERSSLGRCRYSFTPDLSRTFNRGYTEYFATGRKPGMASFDTPKAIGQYVGKVKELHGRSFTVSSTAAFVNGDGLCFFDRQHRLCGFRVNRAEGNRLFPPVMPVGLTVGTPLYRSNDQAMDRMLSKSSAERKIPVSMRLKPYANAGTTGFSLTVDMPRRSVTVSIEAEHQQALTPQNNNIVRELTKLGGTPYECTSVEVSADFKYFIPASRLAALRRLFVNENENVNENVNVNDNLNDNENDNDNENGNHNGNVSCGAGQTWHEGDALMQCRYCIRYEMGYCVKHGGRRPTWHEPLRLRLGDGRTFRLEFDCKRCEMNVYADEK